MIFGLIGCDAYYWITPLAEEFGASYRIDNQGNTVIEQGDTSVLIEGGRAQSPYTKKVEATGLNLSISIECQSEYSVDMSRANVLFADTSISLTIQSITHRISDAKKEREIYNCRKGDSPIDFNYCFDGGSCHISMGCDPYYQGMGLLQFPITINIGQITTTKDTLLLTGLKFEGTRHPPKK